MSKSVKRWEFTINGEFSGYQYDTREEATKHFDCSMIEGWKGEYPIVIDLIPVIVQADGKQ